MIEPKFVFKNVQCTDFIIDKFREFEIKKVILIYDSNVNNAFVKDFIDSTSKKLNLVYVYQYSGGEPTTTNLDLFLQKIHEYEFDALISIGGGSTLDFAKAASVLFPIYDDSLKSSDFQGSNFNFLNKKLCICLPTTAGSGAESTKSAVLFNTVTKIKRGINHINVLPDIVFLVPGLMENLPMDVFYPSVFDGFTHAYESLIGKTSNFETRQSSRAALLIYKRQISQDLKSAKILGETLEASFEAGKAICNSETGPVHALSYPLSEFLGLSHGQAISILLPKVIDHYEECDPDINKELRDIFTIENTSQLLFQLTNIRKVFIDSKINLGTDITIEKLADRSLELSGAINNSPIIWTKEKSIEIYTKLYSEFNVG